MKHKGAAKVALEQWVAVRGASASRLSKVQIAVALEKSGVSFCKMIKVLACYVARMKFFKRQKGFDTWL